MTGPPDDRRLTDPVHREPNDCRRTHPGIREPPGPPGDLPLTEPVHREPPGPSGDRWLTDPGYRPATATSQATCIIWSTPAFSSASLIRTVSPSSPIMSLTVMIASDSKPWIAPSV